MQTRTELRSEKSKFASKKDSDGLLTGFQLVVKLLRRDGTEVQAVNSRGHDIDMEFLHELRATLGLLFQQTTVF